MGFAGPEAGCAAIAGVTGRGPGPGASGCVSGASIGDLRPLVGGRLAQGTLLFEVAPAGAWALELDAPQRVLRDVHPGLRGTFAPAARPEQPQEFILARIGASAEARAGQNVYRLEGPLTTPPDWLRPGMEGVARIHVGPRRVWWVTLHRVVDWLRLHLWL